MPAPSRSDVPLTLATKADAAYFEAMAIRLLAGHGFTDADRKGQPAVLLVNEKLARHWWPKAPQLAVGHPLKLGGPYMEGPTFEIAGVVADVRQAGLDVEPSPEIYLPFAQNVSPAMVVMIRAAGDPSQLIPVARRALASIDRNVPIQSLRPFEEWMGDTLERRRFITLLLAIFAALALILSFVGIYGILNFWVGIRQKEIAIRLALGAQRPEILRWAAWNAVRMVALGITIGLFGGWGVARGLDSMLFGISPRSPAMMLGAVVTVIMMAALAASVPLWRATQVDAIRNLRDA
jgi:putative ABC transport system permease protein